MTPTEVLAALEHNAGVFPHGALTEAMALGPALADDLIAAIERVTENAGETPSDYFLHIHALYLLAVLRERRALEPVLALCRLPQEVVDDLLGHIVTEGLGRAVASIACGDARPVQAVIDRAETGDWVRAALLEALAIGVVQGQLPRDVHAGYLRELFDTRRIPKDHSGSWGELCVDVVDLGITELRPQLVLAYDLDLADPMMMGRQEALDDLDAADGRILDRSRRRYSYIDDPIRELQGWACYQPAEPPAPETPTRTAPLPRKPGRNDPCPCGSGKKFKKCCLGGSRTAEA